MKNSIYIFIIFGGVIMWFLQGIINVKVTKNHIIFLRNPSKIIIKMQRLLLVFTPQMT